MGGDSQNSSSSSSSSNNNNNNTNSSNSNNNNLRPRPDGPPPSPPLTSPVPGLPHPVFEWLELRWIWSIAEARSRHWGTIQVSRAAHAVFAQSMGTRGQVAAMVAYQRAVMDEIVAREALELLLAEQFQLRCWSWL
ncbi:hypothetical protein NW754_009403 [Fusarium falciforme]|nr:hypothetical protein NW754_009403 [Fusarium falciforme]KAJ4260778.1 hypothetical protein NW757_001160 [Fusarium falciforme]